MPATPQPTLADLLATIEALTTQVSNLQAQVATPAKAPKAKAEPKPRPKASHGPKVTEADIARYQSLWDERVTLRKKLGIRKGDLTAFAADAASTDAGMKKIVSAMNKLVAKGLNRFLVEYKKSEVQQEVA
jgi:hypothetical protein